MNPKIETTVIILKYARGYRIFSLKRAMLVILAMMQGMYIDT